MRSSKLLLSRMRAPFRHPKKNALMLGLLQGIPQGLMFKEQKQFVGPGFDESNLVYFVCFGLLVPPAIAAFNHFANGRKNSARWERLSSYVDLNAMIFWGCLSLGIFGWFSLYSSDASEGYAICAFFIAGGIGFLGAGATDRWLKQRVENAA